jgi:hypothetical protein
MQVKVELPPGGLRHLCDTALHPCCSAARLALDLEEGAPMMGLSSRSIARSHCAIAALKG